MIKDKMKKYIGAIDIAKHETLKKSSYALAAFGAAGLTGKLFLDVSLNDIGLLGGSALAGMFLWDDVVKYYEAKKYNPSKTKTSEIINVEYEVIE